LTELINTIKILLLTLNMCATYFKITKQMCCAEYLAQSGSKVQKPFAWLRMDIPVNEDY